MNPRPWIIERSQGDCCNVEAWAPTREAAIAWVEGKLAEERVRWDRYWSVPREGRERPAERYYTEQYAIYELLDGGEVEGHVEQHWPEQWNIDRAR